ncbi:MAG: hypothetical protein RLZZ458_647 [Planctomycetota bacterium]
MDTDLEGELAIDVADFQDLQEEFTEFDGATADVGGNHVGCIDEMIVVIADHGDATAGWRDDIVVAPEDIDEFGCEGLCFVHAAAVGHGLAAAGLSFREVCFDSECLEN